jgi:hypothetical protein
VALSFAVSGFVVWLLTLRLRQPLLAIRRASDLAAGRFDQPPLAHQMHVRHRDHALLRHRVANLRGEVLAL